MPARLGQHFLADSAIAERIAVATAPRAGERLLEIGGGRGALTGPLAELTDDLTVVELDAELATLLAGRFPAIRVIQADVLDLRFAELGGGPWVVAGNIPYAVTSPILVWLCEQRALIRRAVLMMQTEVAERIAAAPGSKEYGRLTVLLRYHAVCEWLLEVGPESFRPPPRVSSTVLRLTFRETPAIAVADDRRFFGLVEASFRWRRKTLRSTLRHWRGWSAERAIEALERAGIDPDRRGETLDLPEFAALAEAVGETGDP